MDSSSMYLENRKDHVKSYVFRVILKKSL